MTLNASKTKVIVFGAGKGDTTDLQMDHEAIEEVMRFKYLAVFFFFSYACHLP